MGRRRNLDAAMRLTYELAIHALREHEWLDKDDNRTVYCPSCGKCHRERKALERREHKPGCAYAALIESIELLFQERLARRGGDEPPQAMDS